MCRENRTCGKGVPSHLVRLQAIDWGPPVVLNSIEITPLRKKISFLSRASHIRIFKIGSRYCSFTKYILEVYKNPFDTGLAYISFS